MYNKEVIVQPQPCRRGTWRLQRTNGFAFRLTSHGRCKIRHVAAINECRLGSQIYNSFSEGYRTSNKARRHLSRVLSLIERHCHRVVICCMADLGSLSAFVTNDKINMRLKHDAELRRNI